MVVGETARERRTVGRTKLALPRIGLGTGPLGGLFEDIPEKVALATIEAAWDEGIRLFDTAAWYGRGHSEHRLGAILRTKPRTDYVLTTKVGRVLSRPADPASFDRSPWVGGLAFEAVFDYTYDGLMRSYEQALQRLGIPVVDALAIHDLDEGFHGPDAFERHRGHLLSSGMRALAELKRSGDVAAVGMGFNTTAAMQRLLPELDLDYALVAHPYTLLDQSSLPTGMALCAERNVSVIVGAPFASGILATGSGAGATYAYGAAPEAIQSKVRRIEALCGKHDVALPAAALQFPLGHPAVAAVIPGAVRAEQAVANMRSFNEAIPPAFWQELRAEAIVEPDCPLPGEPPAR